MRDTTQTTSTARDAGQYRIEKNEDGYWVCEGTHMMGCYRTQAEADKELALLVAAAPKFPPTNASAATTAQLQKIDAEIAELIEADGGADDSISVQLKYTERLNLLAARDAEKITITLPARPVGKTKTRAEVFGAKAAQYAVHEKTGELMRRKDGSQIQVEIETRNPDMTLRRVVEAIVNENPQSRDGAAKIVREFGMAAYIGGRHVAILEGNKRLACITSNAPDFN